ncbi:MAG: aminotransferase class I/II-fold pyridoxal phosphate-dependent enzyme, partial [Marinobacter sp.]
EDIDEYLRHSRRVLKAIGEYVHRRLTEMRVSARKPEGGFYVFPDFSAYREDLDRHDIKTSAAFCKRLLEETGVAMLPASDFGFEPDLLSARLAFVDFDGARALELAAGDFAGQELGDDFVELASPRMVTAMERTEAWLKGL